MTLPVRPRKGDIWLVDFGEPVGHEQGLTRPAVVVSSDRLNRSAAALVVVIPLTTTRRDLPSHVEIPPDGSGLRAESFAKVEDIKSISIKRLLRRIGSADPSVIRRIGEVARLLLDL